MKQRYGNRGDTWKRTEHVHLTIADCLMTNNSSLAPEDMPLPRHVLDVGTLDIVPHLVESDGRMGKYIALNH